MTRFGLLVLLGALSSACSLVAGDLPAAVSEDAGAGGSVAGSTSSGGIGGESSGGSSGQAGSPTGGTANASGSGGGAGSSTSGGVGGTGTCATACDCDEDGQQATSCAGMDCDDNDKRVFSGQTEYFIEASSNPKVLFDFDCSGQIERDPGLDHEVSCGLLSLTGCKGQGFSGSAPTCGVEADWGECRSNGLVCEHVPLSSRVMACH